MKFGLVLPVILAFLSIIFVENFDTIRSGETLDTVEIVSSDSG